MSQIQISEKVKANLTNKANQYKVDLDTVTKIYTDAISSGKNEMQALVTVKKELENDYGNASTTSPIWFVYTLHDFGVSDIFEQMRTKAVKMYNSEDLTIKDEAINKKMVDYDGTPLDYREKEFGKPNENFGKPLVGSSYARTILAIASSDMEFTNPQFLELNISGETANTIPPVEPYKFYRVRGKQNPKYPTKLRISANASFRPYPSIVTASEITNKFDTYNINKLEDVYKELFAGKGFKVPEVAVRGWVTDVNRNVMKSKFADPSKKGKRTFVLCDDDADAMVKCNITEEIPLILKETDQAIVWVKLFPEKSGRIGAQVRAYMII